MIARFTSLALIAVLASCSSSSTDPAPKADTGTSPPADTGGGTADTTPPGDSAPAGNTVTVGGTGFTFSPSTLKVKVGDTVTWTWAAGGHSVTSGSGCAPDGAFDSGVKSAGNTFTQTFTKAGTVDYYCTPHCAAGMKGQIVVE